MDGYLQSTFVANSLQQNISRNNATNAVAQVTRTVPHFPPSNKDFSCTEIHTPDGIYPLLHETFYETIAPQYNIGTRATVVKVKDENQLYNGTMTTESSEDEGLIMGGSLSITPIKSAALPIPNAASTIKMSRTAVQPSSDSISTSFNRTNNPGLQILTSPQKLMIPNNSNGNSASPYSPFSPSFSAT
ncbi:hypothetical protein BDF20DRAFT_798484, partial [Mycotypha africana]|uniref:uncharacterized protein n=1 Tax=Mycotypha africana TaxID=64632 RepID=UPI002301CCE0